MRNSIYNFNSSQIMMQDHCMKIHHMIALYLLHFNKFPCKILQAKYNIFTVLPLFFLFEISLTACNIAKDCYTCLSQDDNFDCKWCQKVRRCSDGIDWLRQEWRDQGCEIQVHSGLFLCCHISVCDSILKLTLIFFLPKYAYK